MNTFFGLLAEFGTAEIPLEHVAPKYFGLSLDQAKRRAAENRLPIPVYRAGSQKAPWLVSADLLASYLDEQKKRASETYAKMNAA